MIRALTLWQPWAWAIAEGHKDVENRDWRPPMGIEWLAIHVGAKPKTMQSMDPARYTLNYIEDTIDQLRFQFGLDIPHGHELPFSGIVAVARIASIHKLGDGKCDSSWRSESEYGWMLADAVKLDEPIPCKGAQGLWAVPDSALPKLRAAVMGMAS